MHNLIPAVKFFETPNESETKGKTVIRSIRHGFEVIIHSMDTNVESKLVGHAIVINNDSPQYKLAERNRWLLPHIMKCTFLTLIEYRDGLAQTTVQTVINTFAIFIRSGLNLYNMASNRESRFNCFFVVSIMR